MAHFRMRYNNSNYVNGCTLWSTFRVHVQRTALPSLLHLEVYGLSLAKDTDFKFGTHALRENPNMTPGKNLEKGAWLGSHEP